MSEPFEISRPSSKTNFSPSLVFDKAENENDLDDLRQKGYIEQCENFDFSSRHILEGYNLKTFKYIQEFLEAENQQEWENRTEVLPVCLLLFSNSNTIKINNFK
jgi:hypothetical protein